VANFKILQGVFEKQEIIKHIDVERLIKGKYQDNLEFCQWMKNYFETNYGGQEYNAKERRQAAKQGTRPAAIGTKSKPESKESETSKVSAVKARLTTVTAKPPASKPSGVISSSKGDAVVQAELIRQTERVKELEQQLGELSVAAQNLEKERNFYFGKLREIEIICQTDEAATVVAKEQVLAILYVILHHSANTQWLPQIQSR